MTGRSGRCWWVLNGGGSGGASAIVFFCECVDLWWKTDVLSVVVYVSVALFDLVLCLMPLNLSSKG